MAYVYSFILLIILLFLLFMLLRKLLQRKCSYNIAGGGKDDTSPFKYVHVNPNPKYTLIYIHGLNPNGAKYAKELFIDSIEKTPYKDTCSYGIFYREKEGDLDYELERFKKYVFDTFPLGQYILIGHSFGACFAKYFMENTRHISKAISLDGFNLHISVPYFLGIPDEKLVYTEDTVTSDGKDYTNHEELLPHYVYTCAYRVQNDNPNYYVIYYNPREDKKDEPSLERTPNKFYQNFYEMYYGAEYSHSIHKHHQCLELILDTILQRV